jgi:hypothetical protein
MGRSKQRPYNAFKRKARFANDSWAQDLVPVRRAVKQHAGRTNP